MRSKFASTLIRVTDGPSAEDLKKGDLMHKLIGNHQSFSFDFEEFLEKTEAIACVHSLFGVRRENSRLIERFRDAEPTEDEFMKLRRILKRRPLTSMIKVGEPGDLLQINGNIGLIERGDGLLHEVFLGEYDPEARTGAFLVLIPEKSQRFAQADGLQSVKFPCPSHAINACLLMGW